MHLGSLIIGFIAGVVASVLFSIFRPSKWEKLQKETSQEIGKKP